MYGVFYENAEHGEILHRFLSLLGSTSQLALNGGQYPWPVTRQKLAARLRKTFKGYLRPLIVWN